MKKALIIGAAGFVGNYLASQILSEGKWSLAATKMKHETMPRDDMEIYDLDLLEPGAVQSLLEQLRPDYIFHLAAQSSVAVSWKNPGLTVDVNIKGTLAVLDAVRQLAADVGIPKDLKDIVKKEDIPFLAQSAYDDACRPGNPRETSVEEIAALYTSLL